MSDLSGAPSDGASDSFVSAPSEGAAPSSREAVDSAFDSVFGTDEDVVGGREPNQERADGSRERTADGRFTTKPDGTPAEAAPGQVKPAGQQPAAAVTPPAGDGPPARLSAEAKAAWATTPEPVKAEINRAVREMEAGIAQHKAAAESFEPVRRFDEMAKQAGTTLPEALTRYTNMEAMLRQDPIRGLETICQNLGNGITLRDIAAHVLGQPPEQRDTTIQALQQEIAALKQGFGGITKTFEDQRMETVTAQISAFMVDHPRTDELSKDISFLLDSGRAKDLDEAYALADRLNPAAQPVATAPTLQASANDRAAQTRKATLSIAGNPSGSNPGARKPAGSARDAVDSAFDSLGL